MAKYTMELREIISTFGEDEVKSWFMDYELSDYLTPDEIKVIEEKNDEINAFLELNKEAAIAKAEEIDAKIQAT